MKPISDALELLTAQHEDIAALLANVQSERDPHALDQLVDKVAMHLALEQLLLYPVVASAITREVLDEVYQEHDTIRHLLAELVWFGIEDPQFADKLSELESLMSGHCGWQEDRLFQQLAESVGAEALASLGQRLAEHESTLPFPLAA